MQIRYIPASYTKTKRPDEVKYVLETMRHDGMVPIIYNDAYAPYWSSRERYQIWYGGAGGAKSHEKATSLLCAAMTMPFFRCLFVRKFKEQVNDSQFLLFKDLIKLHQLQDYFEAKEQPKDIVCTINGNTLLGAGLDDVEKLKSIPDVTDIWIEEPISRKGSVLKEDFLELDTRLRHPVIPCCAHFTFNPISKDSWIHDLFFVKSAYKAQILKTTYLDNHFAPPSEKEKFDRMRDTDPERYKIMCLGEWGDSQGGLIFDSFRICDEFPTAGKFHGHGLDFGYNDPVSLVRGCLHEGAIYLDELIYESEMTEGAIIARFKQLEIKRTAQVFADSSRKDTIVAINHAGYAGVQPVRKGAIADGVVLMKGYPIYVTKRSVNLIREMKAYKWKQNRMTGIMLDEPMEGNDHAIDAARYWAISMLSPVGQKQTTYNPPAGYGF